jgi:D-alanyl-D-alanine carboxypeptidase
MRRPAAASAAFVVAIVATGATALLLGVGTSPATRPDAAAALSSPLPSVAASATARSPSMATLPPASASPAPSPSLSPAPSPSVSPAPLTPEQRNALLQRMVDRFRTANAIPGMSVTIAFPDGTVWTGVSGLADVRHARPVTDTTAFGVASVSKTFLSALVLKLTEEGKLSLGDRVVRYLPDLGLDRRITIRQLLDHTSGLADYFLNPKIDALLQRKRSLTWTAAQALRFVGKPYFPPGKGWHYSNTNYLLLGLVAERVGRASLAEQFRARFFKPLALSTAFYQVAEKPRGPTATAYRLIGPGKKARPTSLADGTGVMPFTSVVSAAGGAGSVGASSRDLALWAKALYGGHVLEPETLALMVGDVAKTARYKPRLPYGLGVQAVTINGLPTLGHSGRMLGTRTVVRFFPTTGVSIAIVTNQSRIDPAPLLARLARIAMVPAQPTGT